VYISIARADALPIDDAFAALVKDARIAVIVLFSSSGPDCARRIRRGGSRSWDSVPDRVVAVPTERRHDTPTLIGPPPRG
jgi:hypothetical protein